MTALDLALRCLQRGQRCVWLQVVASAGSSPGRQGFRMVVAPDGEMAGSIGGGMMEHKLVELARHQLQAGAAEVLLKRQVHRAEAPADRSGMICSGEQTVLLLPLAPAQLPELTVLAAAVAERKPGHFVLTAAGPAVHPTTSLPTRFDWQEAGATAWQYAERLDAREVVHVIGAGHVGLACCELLSKLDFRVRLYDDRADLNTLARNPFADEKLVTAYDEIGQHLPADPAAYVVIMTFGYRTDEVVVRQLLGRDYRYLGLLGSAAKVDKLLADLRAAGFPAEALQQLHAPIGLPIGSRTPTEIAVSVAAQLIQVRHRA